MIQAGFGKNFVSCPEPYETPDPEGVLIRCESDPGVGAPMATGSEYRKYAKECLRWAVRAKTQDERTAFLSMARVWTLAAVRLEGELTTEPEVSTTSPSTH